MKGWVRIVVGVVALAIVAAVVPIAWAWRNPVALYVWSMRRTLDRAGFEDRTLATDGGALHYRAAGNGTPLLFLHGAGDQAGTWATVAPAFADRYRVIVPDLPGHGDSAPADVPLPLTRIVADTVRLLDEVAPDGGAIVVGNSLGAWTACLVAIERPERVERLILVNGGPLQTDFPRSVLVPEDREQARALVARLRDPSAPPVPDLILDDLVDWIGAGATPRLLAASGDFEAHVLDDRMHELTTPADIVWGRSDRLFAEDYPERLLAALPAGRLTWLEDCGHTPQGECALPFRELLDEVLASDPPVTRKNDSADGPDPRTDEGATP